MKKILFLTSLLFVVSCKDHKSSEEKPKVGLVNVATDCPTDTIVVIDKSKIDEFDLWEAENSASYCHKQILNPKCSNTLVIDLNKVGNSDENIAKWLKKNTNYICFNDTYKFIENSHSIIKTSIQGAINSEISAGRSTPYTFNEFKKEIVDFDLYNYEKYIQPYFDTTEKKIKFKPVDPYKSGLKCYSIPLFKSILSNHTISNLDTCVLDFATIKNKKNVDVIVFKVTIGSTVIGFYNYSTDPSGGGRNSYY
jgi:hypothetical protein